MKGSKLGPGQYDPNWVNSFKYNKKGGLLVGKEKSVFKNLNPGPG